MEVVIRRATRNKAQNAALHGALSDIAEQLIWPPRPRKGGELHDIEWWKRRCTLGWLLDEQEGAEVIDDLMGTGKFALLLPRTSDLDKDEMSALVEWTFSFGAKNGVTYTERGHNGGAPIDERAYEGFR